MFIGMCVNFSLEDRDIWDIGVFRYIIFLYFLLPSDSIDFSIHKDNFSHFFLISIYFSRDSPMMFLRQHKQGKTSPRVKVKNKMRHMTDVIWVKK